VCSDNVKSASNKNDDSSTQSYSVMKLCPDTQTHRQTHRIDRSNWTTNVVRKIDGRRTIVGTKVSLTSLRRASSVGCKRDATRIAAERRRASSAAPAARPQLSINISCTYQGAKQQTRRLPSLLSIDETDGQTDGRQTVL